jgi:hypothetical protein
VVFFSAGVGADAEAGLFRFLLSSAAASLWVRAGAPELLDEVVLFLMVLCFEK